MGIMETGVAKTRAMSSDARADLSEVDSKLALAESGLTFAAALDSMARGAAGTWPARQAAVAPLFAMITTQTGALHNRAVASVDELNARRVSATSRLSFADTSNRAMRRLADESDKLLGG